MCDLCNDPDLTIDTHLDRMHQRLTGERFVMLPVAGSRTEPQLSDTIGLPAHGPPELVLVGVLPAEVIRLIRVHGDHRLTEAHSCRDAHVRPSTMEAVEVARPHDRLLLAAAVHGPAARAPQLA